MFRQVLGKDRSHGIVQDIALKPAETAVKKIFFTLLGTSGLNHTKDALMTASRSNSNLDTITSEQFDELIRRMNEQGLLEDPGVAGVNTFRAVKKLDPFW